MITIILSFLTLLAPIAGEPIKKIGVWLVEKFIKNQAKKEEALKKFYADIEAHTNDGKESVNLRDDYNNQIEQVKKDKIEDEEKARREELGVENGEN